MNKFSLVLVSAMVAAGAQGATISFSGQVQAGNLTSNPWVLGSFMWGTVDTGNATATAQTGFTSLNSANISLLTWTFGGLDLTSFQSPGPMTPGFEYYTPGASPQPFTVLYNGDVWATGSIQFLQVDVTDSSDTGALGTGIVTLTAPGVDSAFYNDVLSLTSGTGQLSVAISSFFPVDAFGLFNSVGTVTAAPVPEPGAAALAAAAAALMIAVIRRRCACASKTP